MVRRRDVTQPVGRARKADLAAAVSRPLGAWVGAVVAKGEATGAFEEKPSAEDCGWYAAARDRPRNQFEMFLRRPAGQRQIRTKLSPPRPAPPLTRRTENRQRRPQGHRPDVSSSPPRRGARAYYTTRVYTYQVGACVRVRTSILYSSDEPPAVLLLQFYRELASEWVRTCVCPRARVHNITVWLPVGYSECECEASAQCVP